MAVVEAGAMAQVLGHVGPLGEHDMWVVIPMAVVSAVVVLILARRGSPPVDEDQRDGQPTDSAETSATDP